MRLRRSCREGGRCRKKIGEGLTPSTANSQGAREGISEAFSAGRPATFIRCSSEEWGEGQPISRTRANLRSDATACACGHPPRPSAQLPWAPFRIAGGETLFAAAAHYAVGRPGGIGILGARGGCAGVRKDLLVFSTPSVISSIQNA